MLQGADSVCCGPRRKRPPKWSVVGGEGAEGAAGGDLRVTPSPGHGDCWRPGQARREFGREAGGDGGGGLRPGIRRERGTEGRPRGKGDRLPQ